MARWSLSRSPRAARNNDEISASDRARGSSCEQVARTSAKVAAEIHRVIDKRAVRSLFQPLVHLATGEVVGFEALTRGPAGSDLESPLLLFEAARAVGRAAELDWVCAASACAGALSAGLHPSMSIFFNFEPTTLLTPCPADLLRISRVAEDRLRVFVEMKEQSLILEPSRVFDALSYAREIGWGVAIDNAIASPSSLALLPLIHPDVIKLNVKDLASDLRRLAEISHAIRSYVEQTGATILAEGIETSEDVSVARAVGATFGQGWHYGEPTMLGSGNSTPRAVFPLISVPTMDTTASPYAIVSSACQTAIIEKRFLVPLGHFLEDQVDKDGIPALLFVCHQSDRAMSKCETDRLVGLVERAAFTVGIGPRLDLLEGCVKARLFQAPPSDPISEEWAVIVLGARYAAALVARDLGDGGPDAYRRFTYSITHDRSLVIEAARGMLRRVTPKDQTLEISA